MIQPSQCSDFMIQPSQFRAVDWGFGTAWKYYKQPKVLHIATLGLNCGVLVCFTCATLFLALYLPFFAPSPFSTGENSVLNWYIAEVITQNLIRIKWGAWVSLYCQRWWMDRDSIPKKIWAFHLVVSTVTIIHKEHVIHCSPVCKTGLSGQCSQVTLHFA